MHAVLVTLNDLVLARIGNGEAVLGHNQTLEEPAVNGLQEVTIGDKINGKDTYQKVLMRAGLDPDGNTWGAVTLPFDCPLFPHPSLCGLQQMLPSRKGSIAWSCRTANKHPSE